MTDTRRSSVGSRRGIGTTTADAPLANVLVASRACVNPGASAVPHSEQNFCPGVVAWPHAGHVVDRLAPHSMQNLAPATLSVPQCGQPGAPPVLTPVGSLRGRSPPSPGSTPWQRVELGVGHRADRLADALLDAEPAVSDPAERSELGAPARNLVYVHGSRPQLANAARDRAPVERTDRARQGVARGVGGRDCLVEVAHADDRSDRAETSRARPARPPAKRGRAPPASAAHRRARRAVHGQLRRPVTAAWFRNARRRPRRAAGLVEVGVRDAGFGSLPPSSARRAGSRVVPRSTSPRRRRPSATSTASCARNSSRIAAGSPHTIWAAAGGSPSSSSSSPSRIALSGVRSDGLSTIGAPAAIAGASLCATWFNGWLNGVIAATRPTGTRRVCARRARPFGDTSPANASPSSLRASIAAKRNTSTARATSCLVVRRRPPPKTTRAPSRQARR